MEELRRALDRLSPFATSPLSLGVSPHAPYTVSEPLYRAVADLAGRDARPLAVHLAESRAETMLVRDGTGPFADALHARGFAVRAHNCSPVQYLVQLGVLASGNRLAIHCVQVDGPDIESHLGATRYPARRLGRRGWRDGCPTPRRQVARDTALASSCALAPQSPARVVRPRTGPSRRAPASFPRATRQGARRAAARHDPPGPRRPDTAARSRCTARAGRHRGSGAKWRRG